MADPDEQEAERPTLRETAAKKTRAVTSATTDVMLDAFDKVIGSIDSVATQQQQKAAAKEEKAAAKQERKAEEKAEKAAAKQERKAAKERDPEPPRQP